MISPHSPRRFADRLVDDRGQAGAQFGKSFDAKKPPSLQQQKDVATGAAHSRVHGVAQSALARSAADPMTDGRDTPRSRASDFALASRMHNAMAAERFIGGDISCDRPTRLGKASGCCSRTQV